MFTIQSEKNYSIVVVGNDKKELIRTDKNGVEYLFLDFKILGGAIGSQISKVTRIVRADREPVVFESIVDLLPASEGATHDEKSNNYLGDKATLPKSAVASGVFYRIATEPYYATKSNGERLLITQGPKIGQPVIMTEVRFFCFAEENSNPMGVYERTVRNFDWVVATGDDFEKETDAEEVATNNAPAPKRR